MNISKKYPLKTEQQNNNENEKKPHSKAKQNPNNGIEKTEGFLFFEIDILHESLSERIKIIDKRSVYNKIEQYYSGYACCKSSQSIGYYLIV